MKISMKLVYQYMTNFSTFSTTSNHFHPLQVENCDSNSRLVVGGNDNGKFRIERVKSKLSGYWNLKVNEMKWNEMNRALGHLCAHIG